MKQTIGLILLIVWMALFILGIAGSTIEYEVNNPTWVGWVYIISFLTLPFISINLLASYKK